MTPRRATSSAEGRAAQRKTTNASSSADTARQVLAVEDDPADRRLIEAAIESYRSPVLSTVVGDGGSAIAALSMAPRHYHLVLLDLHLPGADGRAVLEHVRRDRAPTQLPVVVLSSLASDVDTLHCYELGANAVVAKPFDLDGFRDVVHRILRYWLGFPTAPAEPT